jgi:hypothetical protein
MSAFRNPSRFISFTAVSNCAWVEKIPNTTEFAICFDPPLRLSEPACEGLFKIAQRAAAAICAYSDRSALIGSRKAAFLAG